MAFTLFTVLSLVVGLFLFAMFVLFAFYPDRNMQTFFGETINTPAGRNEIRAMIGGTNLGLSLIMFAGAIRPEYQALSYAAVGIVGMAIGFTRLVALLVADRPHTKYNRLDATVEPVGGMILFALSFLA